MSNLTFRFRGEIRTNVDGHRQLNDFYAWANGYTNCRIELDWSNLFFMEANLSALLMAMISKLKMERKLSFYLDPTYLKGDMNIFWRNGLAQYIYRSANKPDDDRKSTIQARAFKIEHIDKFVDHIENDLLQHRGLENMQFLDKRRVKDSYFEIFTNYEIHAETTTPLLTCGQFFPESRELKFTLVDCGVGFLKKIAEQTFNDEKPIRSAVDAIQWAVRGGTTKLDAVGGTGLKNILLYCKKSGGSFHIVSDGCYWCLDGGLTNFTLSQPFLGTTIHLIFR